MKRYLIIGNGIAGTTAAESIRKADGEGEITILTEESYPFYSRIRLMELLAGEAGEDDLTIRKDSWYRENRIGLRLDTQVVDINPDLREVKTASGDVLPYDSLLLASGGYSFVPPLPGAGREGVFSLRTMKDTIAIRDYAATHPRVVLIGGGVLGLEAGNSLRKTGCAVTVVEFFPRLLPRQMDAEGARILQSQMEQMGFTFFLGARSKEIIGSHGVDALLLEDGSRIDCDMIIISAGVRPNSALAEKLRLPMEKGVIVNKRMETKIPGIYAAGDLIEYNGVFYGIWPAAEQQGRVAGSAMAGGDDVYFGTTVSNRLKVVGVDLLAAGDIDADGKKESIAFRDEERFIYRKLVLENNRIIGTILYGDLAGGRRILKAMDSQKDIGDIRNELKNWDLENL